MPTPDVPSGELLAYGHDLSMREPRIKADNVALHVEQLHPDRYNWLVL